jgi:uncharacterized protein YdeI (YjbR/CyaY-like superfamily)
MGIRKTISLDKSEELRCWLQMNHKTKIEIWLVFFKKSSGRQNLTIALAVEETLCFGWNQSRLKPLDPQPFAVRFLPRHQGSIWSLHNFKRVRKLIE